MDNSIIQIIKSEYRLRVIDESLARIEQCITELSLDQIWHKQNPNTNSIGNLLLHLEGNVRQYIISGIGNKQDKRNRSYEFNNAEKLSKEKLLSPLIMTLNESNEIVQSLDPSRLTASLVIQGFEHTTLSAIIHVIEHLSYHVGQVTYYTKYVKDIDTAYYGGLDLDITD